MLNCNRFFSFSFVGCNQKPLLFLFAGNFLPSSNTRVEGESKCEDEEDTWIFPSIQMGAFDVRHDSDLTQRFLQSSSEVGTKFKFATGYFNITSSYQKVLLDSKAQFQVLAAHPKANGFLGLYYREVVGKLLVTQSWSNLIYSVTDRS